MVTPRVVAGRFAIERQAGSGGMGDVYRARDLAAGGDVALKLTRASMDADRFTREAEVLATLRHPAIVRHVAHGATPEGEHYIAMEWLEGEDLADRLARSRLSIEESIALATRVAEALAEAHEKGIVHRDIKPANLFLRGGDVLGLTVLDFGIARVAAAKPVTRTGILVGTPGYMAPEQAKGEKTIDARADVFSLGCVLFECVTGQPAFAGAHVMALLAKILFVDPPRLVEIVPEAPRSLDALVARMLAKDPAQRPEDGAALVRELALLDAARSIAAWSVRPPPASITGGERRVVSLVMAARPTISGSESTAETLRADDVAQSESEIRAAAARGGGVAQRLLDGSLIASFSGAGSATDQAVRAARCALALRDLAPGSPIVVATGGGEFADDVLMGDAIESAVRALGSRGAAREVTIDHVTAGLLGGRFLVEPSANGHKLIGEARGGAVGRTLLGVETRCVGRERDLSLLSGTFEECASERVAKVVLVTAPAGVGKSRLARELSARVRDAWPDARAWIAEADAMSAGSPFGMAAQLVKQAASLLDAEPVDARQKKLAEKVGALIGSAEAPRVTEFLGELVGARFPDAGSVRLRAARADPIVMGDQVRRAFVDLVAAESEAHPLLVVLEDLHWGDLPTIKLVDAMLRDLRDRPLFVLALARPEIHDKFPKIWADREMHEIRLGGLSRRAAEALVADVLGAKASAAVSARVVERAAGNAFYLEELIRAVAEGKGDALPETVIAMMQTRLEALDPGLRRVLRAASVFGDVFWRGAVDALLGGDVPGLRALLQDLADGELISRRAEARFPGEEEYSFRHGLVREAAYAMLPERDRVIGHRLAAEWLEQAGERNALALAEHFERGGEPDRAVPWFARASQVALEGLDLDAGFSIAARAVAAGARGEMLARLRLLQAEMHIWRVAWRSALDASMEAIPLVREGSDDWYLAVGGAVMLSFDRGLTDQVEALIRRLADQGLGAEVTGIVALGFGGGAARALIFMGRYDEARRFLAPLERLERDAARCDPVALGWSRWVRVLEALFMDDDPMRGLELAHASAAAFEQSGDHRMQLFAKVFAGWCLLGLGAFERAEALLREVIASSERRSMRYAEMMARHFLAYAAAGSGAVLDACALLMASRDAFLEAGNRTQEGHARIALAVFRMLAGDHDAARDEALGAIDLLSLDRVNRADALATLAQIELKRGALGSALDAARAAMDILGSVGSLGFSEAHVRLVFVEALAASGDHAGSRAALREARSRLLARADKITDPALRESFLVRVRRNARTLDLAAKRLGDE